MVSLSEGHDDEFDLTEDDLGEAEARIRASMARMRGLLADPGRNEPMPGLAYPLNWRPWRCRYCNYLEICRERLLNDQVPEDEGAQ